MARTVFILSIFLAFSLKSFAGFILIVQNNDKKNNERTPTPQIIYTQSIEAKVKITENHAQTSIEQVFFNPTSRQLEGYFMFPVPKGAVLKDFTMQINGKATPAELLDADKANQIYEDIVRRAKDPALLEYAGQDLFRIRIFPIEANKKKRITISYSQVLSPNNGSFEYIFPLSAKNHSTPRLKKLDIEVNLKSENEIKTLYSPTHQPVYFRQDEYTAQVNLVEENTRSDRDFRLYFNFDTQNIGMSIITYQEPETKQGFFLMNISPGFAQNKNPVVQKDITFVLDVSGSMAGEKIQQAKQALNFCVNNLNQGDRFEIVKFSTEAQILFGQRVAANKPNISAARNFIKNLRAIGGTNVSEAFALALKEKSTPNRPHTIIFITDGKPTIGILDQEKLLAHVKNLNSQNTRIFTFGIGNEINTHLLDKITEQTKAYRSYISPQEDIEIKISDFFTKVSSPVLTGIEVDFNHSARTSKVFPKNIPDLFKGSSITLLGRYEGAATAKVTVKGSVNGKTQTFSYSARLAANPENDFIPALWASRHIGYLLDQMRLNGENPELKQEVIFLAKKYGIITPYTSYLILEDERLEISNRKIQEEQVIFNNRFANPDEFVHERAKDYKRLRKKSGRSSVVSSEEVQSLRHAENIQQTRQGKARMGYRDNTGQQQNLADQVSNVCGRAFYQKGDQWIDLYVQNQKKYKPRRILFGSKEYFRLLKKEPQTAQFLKLGTNVSFVYQNQVYEIYQ